MPKILHLGFGNFHRAHQAWYTQRANAFAASQWSIIGVSMSRPDLRDALAPNGFGYTLALRGAGGAAFDHISVHEQILVAAQDPHSVLAALADPAVQIVTLTVTEKGYSLDQKRCLDLNNPTIRADLSGVAPKSTIGLLAHGLARRAASGLPLTIISCDNLPENGQVLRAAVAGFAAEAGLEIQGYLAEKLRFPNTMVDRITPATTPEMIAEIAAATGKNEPSPVVTESFCEWIIEDDFATPRPSWEEAGAVITKDVAPFEARKLRMLNASHSLLAYGGLLRGHDFVHEAISDPELLRHANGLWDEAQTTLPKAIRADIAAYRHALLARFSVPELRHSLRQIAMDGSLKLPVRILPIVAERVATGQDATHGLSAVASWIAFVIKGQDVQDPQVKTLRDLCNAHSHNFARRQALIDQLGWGNALSGMEDRLDQAVNHWLR